MVCVVHNLGFIDYLEALSLQRELRRKRYDDEIPDCLLILEHPQTISVGKSGKLENILVSPTKLAAKEIPIYFVDRGGDVTYHCPGQIVFYPIIDLRQRGRDVHKYVYGLEEVIIRTLKDSGITGYREPTHAGVWVEGKEIGAIGISLRRWVTTHGFSLNVNPNLDEFSMINICGFTDRKAASMSGLLSCTVPVNEVREKLLGHFSEVFNTELIEEPVTQLKEYYELQPSSKI